MKHLIIGLTLLVLLLLCSLLVLWLAGRFLDEITRSLELLPEVMEAGSSEDVCSVIRNSRLQWESRRGFFRSVFSHTELEEIDQCFASLTAYAEQGESGELRDAHTRMMDMLHELREMDRPYYYNILTVLENRRPPAWTADGRFFPLSFFVFCVYNE